MLKAINDKPTYSLRDISSPKYRYVINRLAMNSTCPKVLTNAAFCRLIAVNQPIEPATPENPINKQVPKLFLICANCLGSFAEIQIKQINDCRTTM